MLLIEHAQRSSDTMLHQMAQELAELITPLVDREEESVEQVARYRGAVLTTMEEEVTDELTHATGGSCATVSPGCEGQTRLSWPGD